MTERSKVIFACVHNAGRSQMAAAWFNELCAPDIARAISAGTEPGDAVHPQVVTVMSEVGMDLSAVKPRLFTAELAAGCELIVTMGCGEQCPVVPGAEVLDWPLADPKGQSAEMVRSIRDDIRQRVSALVEDRGWN